MADRFPPSQQRPALIAFAEALGSRADGLRRDECGDWRIVGKHGHVYAVPEGWQFFVLGWTPRGWTAAKSALDFATICNDGDAEGGFILGRLPAAAEAVAIRKWLGVAKRVEYSEASLARKRSAMQTARELLAQKSALAA
jgi:hypothetical protein